MSTVTWMLPGKGNYVLDQVKTTTCSRNQHAVGGRRGVLIYVRTNISYDQTVSKGGLWEATSPFWAGSSLWVRQRSHLRTVLHNSHTKIN